jgi:FdhD protein
VKETEPTRVWRSEAGRRPTTDADRLAGEEPLEIRVDGHAVSVTMRTPGADAELAAGFLVSEGVIRSGAEVARVEPLAAGGTGNVVDVRLAPGHAVDLTRLTRHVFASSSCGLCGTVTIEAVRGEFAPLAPGAVIDAATLLALPARLRAAQPAFDETGGLHAAALFDVGGQLVVAREDVGRHNAVDKVLGYGLLHGLLPFAAHVLVVSGRASFEIVQKALAGGIPVVAAVSAPSTLAVELAEESGQTLVGFLRPPRFNVYAGPERIRFAD